MSVCRDCGTPTSRRSRARCHPCYWVARRAARVANFAERFWARLDKSGECWTWTGPVDRKGYGLTHNPFSPSSHAHRIAWELTNGPVPAGLVVRHSCDNPPCARPDHLLVGTYADNTRDAVVRGRFPVGEGHRSSKLTEASVRAIRASSETRDVLARRFGVSPSNVSRIRSGQQWRHVA